ncbi:MAG: hypothetical protein HOV94_35035 [Saccharothrix sp.]|nr:hypothetical protein [Saccharothrix sp.]
MSRRSLFTYEGALRVLGRYPHPWLDKADVFLGVSILVGGAVEPGVLSLVDPKNEATSSLRKVLDGITAKLTGLTGANRQDLVAAAHTIIAVTSVFDAFREVLGPDFDRLAVTDDEKFRVMGAEPGGGNEATALPALTALDVPAPNAARGFRENLDGPLTRFFTTAADLVTRFLSGLSGSPGGRGDVVDRSRDKYTHHYLGLAATIPEFHIWAVLGEHAATRAVVEQSGTRLAEVLAEVRTESLERFSRLLSAAAPSAAVRSHRKKLEAAATAVLRKPLLRGSTDTSSIDIAFPTVEDGFVAPAYRLAVHHEAAQISSEQWWADQTEVREDIDAFLAAHLSGQESTTLPLLVLGHPGAGKSLLVDVLAARLPAGRFTVVTVQLRKVRAEDPVHRQIETALSETLAERVDWGAVADEGGDCTRVVLLDGFDELIQASGVQQSTYLEQVRDFQEREANLDRPVAVVITSRTLVADRAHVPPGVRVVKLEEFDDARVERWLDAWNAANAATPGFRPPTLDQVLHHGDLARQPLLLLMLVIYAADPGNPPLNDEDLSKADLYERLINSFVARQARDKGAVRPSADVVGERAAQARWRLSIAALAMFNRGRQYVTDVELDRDLAVFAPGEGPRQRTTFDAPVSEADRTVEDFFFIHSAKWNEGSRTGGRTFEFLHATFGEYLIAEVTLALLRQLVVQSAAGAANPYQRSAPPDDSLLYALISHEALLKRKPILDFARELFHRLDPATRTALLDLLGRLLRSVDDRVRDDKHSSYAPGRSTLVSRMAAYSANLASLRFHLVTEPTPLEALLPGSDGDLTPWRSLVYLWHSGLDEEGWTAVRGAMSIHRPMGSWQSAPYKFRRLSRDHVLEEAEILGDGVLEGAAKAGRFLIGQDASTDEDEQFIVNEALFVLASGSGRPVPPLPMHVQSYRDILDRMDAGARVPALTLRTFAGLLSRDAWALPDAVVARAAKHLVTRTDRVSNPLYDTLPPLVSALTAHPHLLEDGDLAIGRLVDWASKVPQVAPLCLLTAWQARNADEDAHPALDDLVKALDEVVHRHLSTNKSMYLPVTMTDYLLEQPYTTWRFDEALLHGVTEAVQTFVLRVPDHQVSALVGKFREAPDGTRPPDIGIADLESALEARRDRLD